MTPSIDHGGRGVLTPDFTVDKANLSSEATFDSFPIELQQQIVYEHVKTILEDALLDVDMDPNVNIVKARTQLVRLLKTSKGFTQNLMPALKWLQADVQREQKDVEVRAEHRPQARSEPGDGGKFGDLEIDPSSMKPDAADRLFKAERARVKAILKRRNALKDKAKAKAKDQSILEVLGGLGSICKKIVTSYESSSTSASKVGGSTASGVGTMGI